MAVVNTPLSNNNELKWIKQCNQKSETVKPEGENIYLYTTTAEYTSLSAHKTSPGQTIKQTSVNLSGLKPCLFSDHME